MIHACIDTPEHRKIVGFETGTRAQFDFRHGGDPNWVFLESYRVKYRADFTDFLRQPWHYIIDDGGDITLSDDPPIVIIEEIPTPDAGYGLLIGRDGRYLKGADGAFIIGLDPNYSPPPEGELYLIDPNNVFLMDSDGDFLTEAA